jgi:hypothetical protein
MINYISIWGAPNEDARETWIACELGFDDGRCYIYDERLSSRPTLRDLRSRHIGHFIDEVGL